MASTTVDASANLVVIDHTSFTEGHAPIPASPPLSRSESPNVLGEPPVTPPPVAREPATEPPALRRRLPRHGRSDSDTEDEDVVVRQFVRTFRAERAGSDTESDGELLPVRVSPLMRQIACPAAAEEDETEAETEADDADAEEAADAEETDAEEADETDAEEADETEAEAEEVGPELQQGTPETIIEIPVWLFTTTLIAMFVYILFAVYLLTLRCDIPARH